jgi:hypothetical protein
MKDEITSRSPGVRPSPGAACLEQVEAFEISDARPPTDREVLTRRRNNRRVAEPQLQKEKTLDRKI